eukprot:TRINITY_DN13901_c0_g1_i1.p2 TRINITY_DN13901_c0_g1~~TRINITY_DN13901_c0_g1_i1.p2  ORF type:complete len:158 (+),score=41.54 TRINITY_DN13901_c0_g1_i1:66-539(+)
MRTVALAILASLPIVGAWNAAVNPDNIRAGPANPKNTLHRIFSEEGDSGRNKGDPGQYFHQKLVDQHVRRSEHWRRLQTAQRSFLRGSQAAAGVAEGGEQTQEHYGSYAQNLALLREAAAACNQPGRRCDELQLRRLGEGPGGQTLPWANKKHLQEL